MSVYRYWCAFTFPNGKVYWLVVLYRIYRTENLAYIYGRVSTVVKFFAIVWICSCVACLIGNKSVCFERGGICGSATVTAWFCSSSVTSVVGVWTSWVSRHSAEFQRISVWWCWGKTGGAQKSTFGRFLRYPLTLVWLDEGFVLCSLLRGNLFALPTEEV